MMMNLQTSTLLVKLKISQWYNRAYDKRVAKEVADKYDIANSEDSYVKRLLHNSALKKINAAVLDLRMYHNATTLPWSSDSVRILQSSKFFEYRNMITKLTQLFYDEVEKLVEAYPGLVRAAQAEKKAMFDASQYPSPQELRAAFSANVTFMPFPDVEDFRTSLPEEIINQMKSDAQAELLSTLNGANKHLIMRLVDRLETLHTAVATPGKMFRDSTIHSVVETAEMVEGLNITGNADVKRAAALCRDLMAVATPEALRTLPEFRTKFASQVSEALSALKEVA